MHRFRPSAIAMSCTFAVIFTIGACGSDQDPAFDGPTTTRPAGGATTSTTLAPDIKVFSVTVTGNKPEGGAQVAEVKLGENVRIEVTSDTANEVHVHGYDLTGKLEPGVTTRIDLLADKAGQWEIELHEGKVAIATLKVTD